ncbi:hypothetical protein RE628_11220 [Paenibacillus sp. D2_2]|uniref:hypothetical protein n=1 Tax=Paenibacillus sp. D2_2 TaxID=3073092 RepID=UPI00281683A7|nr:hypothetical protein [Paenibacillus sp. D2_2]WMT42797.1 hypothetical protein RE628_11220 [Paenibacillus sp. D2_2]
MNKLIEREKQEVQEALVFFITRLESKLNEYQDSAVENEADIRDLKDAKRAYIKLFGKE